MATKFREWRNFEEICLEPNPPRNGEITVDVKDIPVRWISQGKALRVEPAGSAPTEEVIILSGETIRPHFYYKDLTEQLAMWQRRAHLLALPNTAKDLDDAVTISRVRIQELIEGTDLPIRILGQSLGGYILARLAFNDTALNTDQIESLHFDAPAFTGKIFSKEDLKKFGANCLAAPDSALLRQGRKLSPRGYQKIFGTSAKAAAKLSRESQPTSGLIRNLAIHGLAGTFAEVTNFPKKKKIYVHARTDDTGVNYELLKQRISYLQDIGIEIEFITETGGHLNLTDMPPDQVPLAFNELF